MITGNLKLSARTVRTFKQNSSHGNKMKVYTAQFALFTALTIAMCVLIFIMSSHDGTDSEVDSMKVGMLFGRLFIPGFASWDAARQTATAMMIDHPIRKAAHMTEYGVLALLSCMAYYYHMKMQNLRKLFQIVAGEKVSLFKVSPFYRAFVYALVGAFAYSMTDEFHQTFVPGRSGQFTDCLFDTTGALIALLLLALIRRVTRKWRKRKWGIN